MLRVTGARRGRIPTLGERYSSRLGFTRANPALEPESAWHVGLDLDWSATSWLDVQLAAFDAEVSDLISSEYLPAANGVTQKQNVGRARLAGAEVALAFAPIEQLELTAGYAYLHARRLDPIEDEDRIAQIPAHQAVAGAVARPTAGLTVSTYLRVIGPQAFDDYAILGLGELGAYAVWDARLEAEPRPGLLVYVQGANLLDMNYQTRYGYPDRGLNLWLGVRVTVD
jgi:iron complex outermembrane receptor protein